MNENTVNQLVEEWDDVYKKGQLSFWVLLSIYEGEKYALQITEFMDTVSGGQFEVKEQSLYRALRRFKDMGLVSIEQRESPNSGPKRKYYSLTQTGIAVLQQFSERNIIPLTQDPTHLLVIKLQQERFHCENQ